jgi:hypothetical protein
MYGAERPISRSGRLESVLGRRRQNRAAASVVARRPMSWKAWSVNAKPLWHLAACLAGEQTKARDFLLAERILLARDEAVEAHRRRTKVRSRSRSPGRD